MQINGWGFSCSNSALGWLRKFLWPSQKSWTLNIPFQEIRRKKFQFYGFWPPEISLEIFSIFYVSTCGAIFDNKNVSSHKFWFIRWFAAAAKCPRSKPLCCREKLKMYRLFFLRSIAQFFTRIYMNCFVSL